MRRNEFRSFIIGIALFAVINGNPGAGVSAGERSAGEAAAEELSADGWSWLPGGITFRPAIASVYEPRAGFTFFGKDGDIRLDIGTGIDLVAKSWHGGTLAIGGEFITYTLLGSWDRMYFPVIASDYFFGVNLSYSRPVDGNEYSARLRLTHISAHFVDGHYDPDTGEWRNGREPIIYSREFIDLLGSYLWNARHLIHRWYGGMLYLYNTSPGWPGKWNFQGGYELFFPTPYERVTPYAAYDLRLVEIGDWNINHSVQAGVKLGHRFGRGIELFFSYYNGYNVHGMFFDEEIRYWGGGFNLHL
jgi:hypothetical protein